MEPVSLAVGAVGLAALFSTCLECFGYFQAVKAFGNDFDLLIVKLDCQKERLLTWGELVGILSSEDGHSWETDSPRKALITRCLASIKSLLSDTEKLQKEYGVRTITSASVALEDRTKDLSSRRMDQFRASYLRLGLLVSRSRDRPTVASQVKWAIHDKTKFETLIIHIRDLVTELHNLYPVSERVQEKLVHADIASLELPELQSVQKACEGTYQTWSDIASGILMASVAGTIGRPSVGAWLEDTPGLEGRGPDPALDPDFVAGHDRGRKIDSSTFTLTVSEMTSFYLVFTGPCIFHRQGSLQCHDRVLGLTSLRINGISFFSEFANMRSATISIGERITESMDVTFTPQDLEMIRYRGLEMSSHQRAALDANLPLGTVYVYCAPCACAIRTALAICKSGSKGRYLPYLTRVDGRIPASCCSKETEMERLISLVDMVKEIEVAPEYESGGLDTHLIQYIDRVWIEQRIYQLEEELYVDAGPPTTVELISELLSELKFEKKKTGIVILGELGHCGWMLRTAPFPWTPRMPKETEIYRLRKDDGVWQRTFMGTYTPREFRSARRSRVSAQSVNFPNESINTSLSVNGGPEPSLLNRSVGSTVGPPNNVKDTRHMQNKDEMASTKDEIGNVSQYHEG